MPKNNCLSNANLGPPTKDGGLGGDYVHMRAIYIRELVFYLVDLERSITKGLRPQLAKDPYYEISRILDDDFKFGE